MPSLFSPLPRRIALLAALCAATVPAQATIQFIAGGANSSELFLTVLDQTNAKMSYTLDLGVTTRDFYIAAQQDTGASLFRTLDPATDAAFSTFLASANLSTTRWMITGIQFDPANQVNNQLFTTATNDGVVATQTASFDRMSSPFSGDFAGTFTGIQTYLGNLNVAAPGGALPILASTHNSVANGSSVASKPAGDTQTYAQLLGGFTDTVGGGDGDCLINGKFCAGNPLGKSSWFYRITAAQDEDGNVDNFSKVILDEFDNLTADGYWGFIKDPNSSNYILSYTLNGANPKTLVSTDAGRVRQSFLDYSAQSGSVRLIGGVAVDDVAFTTGNAITAVPEPQAWALMLAGLSTFAGLRRLSTRAAKAD